jgi:pyridoxamine 5'-phosphate oxidase
MSLSDLRKDYVSSGLSEASLDPNPFQQFSRWFQQALDAALPEPNAMTLATATREGKASARIVLLKIFDEQGFVFYTNYESQKGKELAENPYAALVFHWIELERQVCAAGRVSRVSREESESYFHSRPVGSQLGAWASRQSQVISGREILEDRLKQLEKDYRDKLIPLPSDWGGFRLAPEMIEFWQGRPNRLHDRLRYRLLDRRWVIERLAP